MSVIDLRLYAACACIVFSLVPGPGTAADKAVPNASDLAAMSARFAPVEVRVDLSALPDEERAALARLIEASR